MRKLAIALSSLAAGLILGLSALSYADGLGPIGWFTLGTTHVNLGQTTTTVSGLTLASPSTSGTVTLPDTSTWTSSGVTMAQIIAMGNHAITGASGFKGNNSGSGEILGTAASSTAPTLVPTQNSATTGWGAQATGNMSGITGGAEQIRITTGATDIVTALAGDTNGHVLISATAPTISSGFGSTPSIVSNNGSAAFQINVGTGGSATSGVIGLPSATNGWSVQCADVTHADVTTQTASSQTTATVTGASAWTASDKLNCTAHAF